MQNLFSYPLIVDDLGTGIRNYKLTADQKQLNYIADVLKVTDVKNFSAEMKVKLEKKEHKLTVSGKAVADIELISVITLEHFIKNYSPEFEVIYDTQLTLKDLEGMEFDFEDEVPDIIIDGKIDLAAIAMEQIALVLDDFPRQDGEEFVFESEFDEETTKAANPFAVLEKLKK